MTTFQERAAKAAEIKKELAKETMLSDNYEEHEGHIKSKRGRWLFNDAWEVKDLGYPRESEDPWDRRHTVKVNVEVRMPDQLFSLLMNKILPYCQSGYGRYTMSAWISARFNEYMQMLLTNPELFGKVMFQHARSNDSEDRLNQLPEYKIAKIQES